MIVNIINKRPSLGYAIQTGKWYCGFEILVCSPQKFRIFKPYLFIWCMKIIDQGEPYKLGGREMVKSGGYWSFESPVGVSIQFVRD